MRHHLMMLAYAMSKVDFAASPEKSFPFDNGITQLFPALESLETNVKKSGLLSAAPRAALTLFNYVLCAS